VINAKFWLIGLLLIAGLLLSAALTIWPPFLRFVEQSGVNVPASSAYLDYCQGIAWAVFLSALILIWPVTLKDRIMLLMMWLIRCGVMLLVMLPYEEHYVGLDCWSYFVGAHTIASDPVAALLKGGSDFVMLIGAMQLKIGPDSYHAMKLSFGYVGLLAIYLLYRAASALAGSQRPWMFWTLGLYPSILFWSSILGKDPVVLLGIAIHIWGLVRVAHHSEHKHLWTAIGGLGLASVVRVWMGPILLLPALLLFALKIRHKGWRLLTIVIGIALFAVLAPATMSRLDIDPTVDLFSSTQSFTRGWDKANSALYTDIELNSLTDLILFTPRSVFTAYFRPLPGDLPHAFGLMAGCEDLALLLLTIWGFLKLRRRHWRNHFFLWALALLATWGLAYSLVTYKDLGTAVRFRLQIMPVLLGVLCYLLARPAAKPRRPQEVRKFVYA